MPAVEIAYCPQCILFVFAAMGFYQYVLRDRIRNGPAGEDDDDIFDMDIDEMDESTQLLMLELLANDHRVRFPEPTDRDDDRRRNIA